MRSVTKALCLPSNLESMWNLKNLDSWVMLGATESCLRPMQKLSPSVLNVQGSNTFPFLILHSRWHWRGASHTFSILGFHGKGPQNQPALPQAQPAVLHARQKYFVGFCTSKGIIARTQACTLFVSIWNENWIRVLWHLRAKSIEEFPKALSRHISCCEHTLPGRSELLHWAVSYITCLRIPSVCFYLLADRLLCNYTCVSLNHCGRHTIRHTSAGEGKCCVAAWFLSIFVLSLRSAKQ